MLTMDTVVYFKKDTNRKSSLSSSVVDGSVTLVGLRRCSLNTPEPQRKCTSRRGKLHSINLDTCRSDGQSAAAINTSSSTSSWSELDRLKRNNSSNSVKSETRSTMNLSRMSSLNSRKSSEVRRDSSIGNKCDRNGIKTRPRSTTGCSPNGSMEKDKEEAKEEIVVEENLLFPEPEEKPDDANYFKCGRWKVKKARKLPDISLNTTIEPHSRWYVLWLFIIALAFLYNAWAIPLRACFFTMQNERTLPYWLTCDYVADLLYLIDIIFVKCRINFVNNGVVDQRLSEAKKNYLRKFDFKLDVISLLPLDIFYLVIGRVNPVLRISRLLKIKSFWEFFDRFDQAAKSGHIIRVLKTCTYMLYLIHIEGCGYYLVSYLQGFESSDWVFNPKKHTVTPYIRCFYIATKTATSIGKNPIPTNDLEYIFMTIYWLSGVFVFASLIGQIRDIVEAAGAVKSNYRKTMDITIWYMQSLNLPKDLQNRVRTWFNYNWDQQKTLNENNLIETLPRKIRTDLAIHVHFQTLSKVKLFQDCDKNLLYDLILKLKPVLYLPGDYICKKGEVGTEMYIVMNGSVQVVGGLYNDTVFATLHMGSVFGEISLLAMSGGNRRTADVRSKGFSNLFLLSKADFDEAMTDYPEAAVLLRKRAEQLLIQNKKIEEDAKNETEAEEADKIQPRPLTTIMKVKPDLGVLRYLGRKLNPNQVTPGNEGATVKRTTPSPTDRPSSTDTEAIGDEMPSVEKLDSAGAIGYEMPSGEKLDSAGSTTSLGSKISTGECHSLTDALSLEDAVHPVHQIDNVVSFSDYELDSLLEDMEKDKILTPISIQDDVMIVDETDVTDAVALQLRKHRYIVNNRTPHGSMSSIRSSTFDVSSAPSIEDIKHQQTCGMSPETNADTKHESPRRSLDASNIVTCDVDVHREISQSPTALDTNTTGVDNFAFIASDSNYSIKQSRSGHGISS